MTVGLSAATANSMLDTALNTTPTVKAHKGDPGAAGTANVSVGDAGAKTLAWAAASGGVKSRSGAAPQWANSGTSETLTHLSVWSAGVFKFSVPLAVPQAWVAGQVATIITLSASLAPLAA